MLYTHIHPKTYSTCLLRPLYSRPGLLQQSNPMQAFCLRFDFEGAGMTFMYYRGPNLWCTLYFTTIDIVTTDQYCRLFRLV